MNTRAWLVVVAFCVLLAFLVGHVSGVKSHMKRVEHMKKIDRMSRGLE